MRALAFLLVLAECAPSVLVDEATGGGTAVETTEATGVGGGWTTSGSSASSSSSSSSSGALVDAGSDAAACPPGFVASVSYFEDSAGHATCVSVDASCPGGWVVIDGTPQFLCY